VAINVLLAHSHGEAARVLKAFKTENPHHYQGVIIVIAPKIEKYRG
jgi:hypothetical protein